MKVKAMHQETLNFGKPHRTSAATKVAATAAGNTSTVAPAARKETKEEEAERRERGRLKKEAERAKALERRALALGFEKNNYSKIFIFRAENGFFLCGNHSAVILFNLIKPELGLKMTIRKDNNFEARFDQLISMKNLEFYKTRLLTSKYLKPTFEQTEDRLVFELKRPLTRKAFSLLKDSEKTKREVLLNQASSGAVLPNMHEKFRDLAKVTYRQVNHGGDRLARELYLNALAQHTSLAFREFLKGCRKSDQLMDGLTKAEALLSEALLDLVQIEAAGVWHITECRQISFLATTLRTDIQVEKKKLEVADMPDGKKKRGAANILADKKELEVAA